MKTSRPELRITSIARQERKQTPMLPTIAAPVQILIVDDDPLVLGSLSKGLRDGGYEVTAVRDAQNALDAAAKIQFDLALIGMKTGDASSEAFARRLACEHAVPFIFLSAGVELDLIRRANQLGAVGYLVKPLAAAQVVAEIEINLVKAHELGALKEKEGQLSRALENGRETSLATGILMERLGIDRDRAFEMLRSNARNQRRRISEIAGEVIAASEVMNRLALRH